MTVFLPSPSPPPHQQYSRARDESGAGETPRSALPKLRARGRRVPWPVEKQQQLSLLGSDQHAKHTSGAHGAQKVLTDVTRRKTTSRRRWRICPAERAGAASIKTSMDAGWFRRAIPRITRDGARGWFHTQTGWIGDDSTRPPADRPKRMGCQAAKTGTLFVMNLPDGAI